MNNTVEVNTIKQDMIKITGYIEDLDIPTYKVDIAGVEPIYLTEGELKTLMSMGEQFDKLVNEVEEKIGE